ncbi:hypothetical protein LB562_22940 [Mesorhizobium sp. B263B1A]|uniref:hypothetical protein n=1 Tax=Mesorhizobium sp. B263B1A TaxID=2876670 RepID=UPI001CD1901F|nr:hypothetical protein [Mesorhizobium sp. B263B1A]MCA0027334.1 hypothetical protein [Mesorhizobium sp. B263B1A]
MPRPDVEAFIDGNAKGFEKAMADIRRLTQQTARGASADFAALSSKIAGISRGVTASLAAIGIGFSLDGVRNAIKEVADIGDVSDKVGLTTDALQELRYAADKTGASTDALDRSMATFSKSIAEVATGADNDLARVLKANNVELRDQDGNLRKQIDILGDYANLIKNARTEQDQLRLATIAFGDRGGDLVNTFRGGADAIRAMRDEAHDLGLVLSNDMVASADEIDKKFQALANTVEVGLKGAIIRAAEDLENFIDKFQSFENQKSSSLDDQLAGIGKQRLDIENQIKRYQNGEQPDDGIFGTSLGQSTAGEAIQALERENEALAENERQILNVVSARRKDAEARKAAAAASPPDKPTVIPPAPKAGGAKGHRPTGDDRVADDLQAVKDRTAALEAERQALGLSFKEQQQRQIALDLEHQALKDVREEARRKGDQDWQNAQLSQKQVADIDAVSEAYAEQADQLRKATEEHELQRDVLKGGFSDLRSALQDGKLDWKDLGDIAMNALNKIVDKIVLDLVDAIDQANSAASGGGGGGILGLLTKGIGALFGGGGSGQPPIVGGDPWAGMRAKGGPVTAGQPYIVGEKRPELFVPRVSGVIVPKVPDMDRYAGEAAAPNASITYAPTITIGPNAQPGVAEQLEAVMKKQQREFTSNVARSLREMKIKGIRA